MIRVRLIAKLPTIVAAFVRLRRGDDHILPREALGHRAIFCTCSPESSGTMSPDTGCLSDPTCRAYHERFHLQRPGDRFHPPRMPIERVSSHRTLWGLSTAGLTRSREDAERDRDRRNARPYISRSLLLMKDYGASSPRI